MESYTAMIQIIQNRLKKNCGPFLQKLVHRHLGFIQDIFGLPGSVWYADFAESEMQKQQMEMRMENKITLILAQLQSSQEFL